MKARDINTGACFLRMSTATEQNISGVKSPNQNRYLSHADITPASGMIGSTASGSPLKSASKTLSTTTAPISHTATCATRAITLNPL